MNILFSRLEHDLIDVAPAPVFAGLEGLDDRVIGRMEMPGRVRVLRGVATAHVSTDEAFAQMHPGVPNFQTLLSALCARCHLSDLIEMATLLCH